MADLLAILRAGIAARSWRVVLPVELALAAGGLVWRYQLIDLPIIENRIPAGLLVGIVSIVIATVPLCDWFAELSRTLAREPIVRAWRMVTAAILVACAYTPTALANPASPADTSLVLLLSAIALLGLVLIGDLTWMAVLGLGFVLLLVDSGPNQPITRMAVAIPPPALILLALVSAATYQWHGPRRH